MTLKRGTRIEAHGTPAFGVSPETAKIVRRRPDCPGPGDWYNVRFDSDGGQLCLHESHFRVIDNR